MRRHVRWVVCGIGLVVVLSSAMAQEESAGSAPAEHMAGVLCARAEGSGTTLFLPLKLTEVRIRLVAGIVSATVTQDFINDTPHNLEAVYIFPLPSNATVTDMELRIGERLIRSVVQKKAEARQTYEQAKQAGKAAALVEANRPNIFRTSVANFRPGEMARVTFSYTQVADVREGIYGITFPMVVGRRYFPAACRGAPDADDAAGPEDQGEGADLNPPVLHPAIDPQHRVILEAEIFGMPVDRIESTTHAIRVAPLDGSAWAHRVTLAEELVLPDSEFHLDVHASRDIDPTLTWVAHTEGQAMQGLLTVFPPLGRDIMESPARDVVFLIDTSGSMDGASIGQARAGLIECLHMLRRWDRFNIVRFACDFSSFAPAPRPAEPALLRQAVAYVNALDADGGTEMQTALRHVLTTLSGARQVPIVVLLTDGCVGNETTLMRLLQRELGRVRLFTFGIGSAPNDYLMRTMARLGRGQSRFIRSHEDIGAVMADFFKTLTSPVMTDITVTWEDAWGHPIPSVSAYPHPCPDVFVDRPLQLVAGFGDERPARAVVDGLIGGERRSLAYTLDADPLSHAMVGRLFARARIDELEAAMRAAATPKEQALLRDEIVEVALRYQLVTPYTARVAVEERIEHATDGTRTTVHVPAPPPRGWATVGATGTQDTLLVLIGVAFLLAAGVARCARGRSPAATP